MSKMATREAYGLALRDIVVENKDIIVLDADLSGATKTCYAKEARPDQWFSTGIAEANMVSMAAGIAAQGLKPFISSFAMFLAGRAYEQVRNSVGYPHLNVKLCATHAGITVGEDGATHQCNEDIALMRTIPGMVVLQPADETETRAMINFMKDYVGPVYMRTCRFAAEDVFDDTYKFELGKIVPVKEGKKVAFLATGYMVQEATKAAAALAEKGIEPAIYNVPTIKPMNVDQLNDILASYDLVYTMEEHSVVGGLYSAVKEVSEVNTKIVPIGVQDTYCESGSPALLLEKYGMSASCIVEDVLKRI